MNGTRFLSLVVVAVGMVAFLGCRPKDNTMIGSYCDNDQQCKSGVCIENACRSAMGDFDHDGLTNGQEVNIFHTDPAKKDTDGDGVGDFHEVYYTKDGKKTDTPPDDDHDGKINAVESSKDDRDHDCIVDQEDAEDDKYNGKTCADQGYECGQWDNGCGKILDCGTCESGASCHGHKCLNDQDIYIDIQNDVSADAATDAATDTTTDAATDTATDTDAVPDASPAPAGCTGVLSFPDPALAAVVRAAAHKPKGDLYWTDVKDIEALDAPSKGISDLSGLECLTGLKSMDISHNQVKDISSIGKIKGLQGLVLNHNHIVDLGPLAELDLKELEASENNIQDVNALSGMTGLVFLSLNHNRIKDISPLAGLTALVSLDLGYNIIRAMDPLKSLVNLTTLFLNNNQITDISAVANLKNLTLFQAQGNEIANISALSGLTKLTNLGLGDNEVSDIKPISGLTGLKSLSIGNKVKDIELLGAMTSLETLDLSGNPITDFSVLKRFTKLQYLTLDDTGFKAFTLLQDMENLQWLSVAGCGLGDNDVGYLPTGLTHLDVSSNDLTSLGFTDGLDSLTELSFSTNKVVDISPLTNLASIERIDGSYNRITDLSPLVGADNIKDNVSIDFTSNPIDCTKQAGNIQAIINQGADLQTNCH